MVSTLTGFLIVPAARPIQGSHGSVILRHLIAADVSLPFRFQFRRQLIPPCFTGKVIRRQNVGWVTHMQTADPAAAAVRYDWKRRRQNNNLRFRMNSLLFSGHDSAADSGKSD